MTREYMLNALRKRRYFVEFLSDGRIELFFQFDSNSPKRSRGVYRSLTAAYKMVRICLLIP